jgi:thioredoxin 1
MKPVIVTEENFDQVVTSSTQPVLVDFWAPWCGPCRMLAPVLDEIAKEQEGTAIVAKVDIDSNPALAQRFNIRAIPTLMVFRNGEVVNTLQGLTPKAKLTEALAA